MSIRALSLLVVLVPVLTILPATRAELPNACGRYLGIGWSDGYHSHTACPPKAPVLIHKQVVAMAAPLPWWKLPAVDASSSTISASSHPTSGPSLFRQSGEGTSVHAPTLAQP